MELARIADSQLYKATTVRPECGSTFDHWYAAAAYEAHHASHFTRPIATGPATDFVQAGGTGLLVPQWACTCLPGRLLPDPPPPVRS